MTARLWRQAAVYGLAVAATRLGGVLLLPLYTRLFSPDQFGRLDVTAAAVSLLGLALGLGLDQATLRFVPDGEGEGRRRESFASALWVRMLVVVPAALVLWPLAGPLFQAALAALAAGALWSHLLLLPRLAGQAGRHAALSLAAFVLEAILSVFLVVALDAGVAGIFWGRAAAQGGLALAMLPGSRDWLGRPSLSGARPLLAYGLPLVPGAVTFQLVQNLDRWFLLGWCGEAEVGLYGLAWRWVGVLGLAAAGFNLAWSPFVWSVYRTEDGRRAVAEVFRWYSWAVSLLALATGLFAAEAIALVASPSYGGAAGVAWILAGAMVFYYVPGHFSIGLGASGRTGLRLAAGLAALAADAVLNLLLVPGWGPLGAAWSTWVAMALYGAILMGMSQRLLPVPYDLGRHAAMSAGFLAAAALAHGLGPGWKAAVLGVVGLGLPAALGILRQRGSGSAPR